MGASQAFTLEQFLEGKGFAKKSGASLLTGLGARLLRASDLPSAGAVHPVGEATLVLPSLEKLLRGRFDRKLIEVVGRRSCGRFSIALAAIACATASGQDAALIDLGDQLDPQAAQAAGVDLARLLWVRPRRLKEALSAAEMLLSAGFRFVVADMGLSPRGGRFLPDAAWVRLARAVEKQGSTLLLSTPYRMSGVTADAVVSASAARPVWCGNARARLLAGISSRLTLEKFGRETPGSVAPTTLHVPEALLPLPQSSSDHPITRSLDRPMAGRPSASIFHSA